MAKRKALSPSEWFDNCGGWPPRHDLGVLRRAIDAGMLQRAGRVRDDRGPGRRVGLAGGVAEQPRAGADTERPHFRTGATALWMAVWEGTEPVVAALAAGGANPDAPNHWGLTPRARASRTGATSFDHVPPREAPLPPPHIQNAERLAGHSRPRFQIPDWEEREAMQVGQAFDLYVFGPRSETKRDTVKVRITAPGRPASEGALRRRR